MCKESVQSCDHTSLELGHQKTKQPIRSYRRNYVKRKGRMEEREKIEREKNKKKKATIS